MRESQKLAEYHINLFCPMYSNVSKKFSLGIGSINYRVMRELGPEQQYLGRLFPGPMF